MDSLRRSVVVCAALTLFSTAIAQTSPPHYRARFAGPFARLGPEITGAPFAIEQEAVVMVRYADGHRSPRAGQEWLYRDSQGRTRVERPMTNPDSEPVIRLVQITDPIAGYQYVIDTVNKVAHRIKVPMISPLAYQSGVDASPPTYSIEEMSRHSFHRDILIVENLANAPPKIRSEDIGARIIEGMPARGVRTIIEYSAERATEPPLVISTEAWVSDHRKIVVLSTRHDPKWGDSMARLVQASFTEPDGSLFHPPPDYRIVDEHGAFIIDIAFPESH